MLPAHLHCIPFSLLPSIFQRLLLFTNFYCSFFNSLCSLLLFSLSPCSLIIFLAPRSISQFFAAPCSLFQSLCSLLPDYVFHAPCSLPYFRSCSLLPWVSRAILLAPWLPITGVRIRAYLFKDGSYWAKMRRYCKTLKFREHRGGGQGGQGQYGNL